MGDVAQWLESRNSNPKTLGSIPWQCRVRDSLSPLSQLGLVQTCLCLIPLCVYGTQIYAHVTDPVSICRKRVGLTTMETRGNTKTLHTGGEKKKVG